MTRSQILQRAKQGDERAIALVLNHVFKKRGIQTHVSRKPEGLRVVLILLEPIDRTQVLPRLRHALGKLEIPSVESVRTVACLQGNSEPLWKYEFSLKLQPSVRLESMDLRQETVRKTQTPTPDNTGFWPVFFPYPK
ncbi:hypothetical protein, partial [Baaleninema sp.]|uniref:hypothetical protein n=1 Tax=Baaleninema sp. TaxID=3101197 RepID=UPI003CFDFB20